MNTADQTFTRTMDWIASAALGGAIAFLLISFNVSNELGAAVSFGAFVTAFVGAISAISIGHLTPSTG